jgi:uncharacterized protein
MSTPAKVSIEVENGAERLKALDWRRISQELDNQGSVVLERLASADECRALAAMYLKDEFFRAHWGEPPTMTYRSVLFHLTSQPGG